MSILTHWGRVTHTCVGNLTIIGLDNYLSPGRRQAIIWTNAEILLIGPQGTNFSEILFGILTFSFKKMCLKMSSAKWRPFCLGLNVLIKWYRCLIYTIKRVGYTPVNKHIFDKPTGLFCQLLGVFVVTLYMLNCVNKHKYILTRPQCLYTASLNNINNYVSLIGYWTDGELLSTCT